MEPAPSVSKWKNKVIPGGSAIYDLGTHLLDQAVYLLGLPQRVTGFVGSQREVNTSGFEDSFTVLLHYPKGAMVTAKAGVISPEEEQLRFWVRGEKGSFKKVGLFICLFIFYLTLSCLSSGSVHGGRSMLTAIVPPRYPRRPAQGWHETRG